MARQKLYNIYNTYFYLPFLLWMLVGGMLMLNYSQPYLFASVNTAHAAFWDKLMPLLTKGGEALFIAGLSILLMFCFKRYRHWLFALMVLACTLLPSLLTQVLKHHYEAPRPLTVFKGQHWVHHLPEWDFLFHNSFPSGHTTGAFGFFCLLSLVLPSRYRYMGVVLFLLALFTAYSRLYLAAHFFEDVYVGSIIGVVCSTALFGLFRILDSRLNLKSSLF